MVDFPNTTGHEQAGARPAIVYSSNISGTVVVVPCTSNEDALRFPFTLLVEPNKRNGLSLTSVALVFQIRVISTKRLSKFVGSIDRSVLQTLDAQMKQFLNL